MRFKYYKEHTIFRKCSFIRDSHCTRCPVFMCSFWQPPPIIPCLLYVVLGPPLPPSLADSAHLSPPAPYPAGLSHGHPTSSKHSLGHLLRAHLNTVPSPAASPWGYLVLAEEERGL